MKIAIVGACVAAGLYLAVPQAHAFTAGDWCETVAHTVIMGDRTLDPERHHDWMISAYRATQSMAGIAGMDEYAAFARCIRPVLKAHGWDHDDAVISWRWSDIKRAATVNPCGDDNQTFVYGEGCMSNGDAALLKELRKRQ